MKNLTLIRVAAAWLLVLFLSSYLPAQTNISGAVSGVWNLAGSPYLIVGDANVPADSSLQIEPGVSVKFTGEYVLLINGNLQAIGTEQDKVEFTSITYFTQGLHIINGQDTCRLTHCTFKYFNDRTEMVNDYGKGGAVYASTTKIAIASCVFNCNYLILNYDYGIYYPCFGLGGAICLENCSGYLTNSVINGNGISNQESQNDWYIGKGGGIYNSGNVVIKNNEISGNYIDLIACCITIENASAYGGGVWTNGWLCNNYIYSNHCKAHAGADDFMGFDAFADGTSEGGGIYGGSLIRNNLVIGNYCDASGNSSSASGYPTGAAASKGGGIMNGETVQNNTVLLNYVVAIANGSATMEGSGVYGGTLSNSIVYNNTGSPQVNSSSVTYSCIQGGYTGTGNISADPLFVTGPEGDYYLSQLAAGQSQQSPCVNVGAPASPMFPGTTRTDGFPDIGLIDMGYHYPSPYNIAMLDMKVMLQGPFAGSTMQNNLNTNNCLPLMHPFQGAPWYYSGTESVAAIPSSNIVDWVLLELRQAPGAAQALPGTMLCRQACFVNYNGLVTGLAGEPELPVNLTNPQTIDPGNNLYVIVWHRNHLGVLSAEPMQETGLYTYSYDFTTGAEKAYGGVNGHIEVGQGIWGMVSGDGDANGQVNNMDKVDVWKPQGGQSGYLAGDFNMDGQVGNQDKIDRWAPNTGRSCQVSFTMPGSLPTVVTNSVNNVTCCTATVTGEVTGEGSYPVTERGFCWSTSPYPSLYNTHSHNGSGTGILSELISGLNPSTTYYVRAYATSILGTAYGNELALTTLGPLPILTASPVSNISWTTATSGGNVIDEGAYPVTARGVCWSTAQNPTLSDSHTVDGSGSGVFVSQIIGLTPLTNYYVRAYATNQAGTIYGSQVSFTTLDPHPVVSTASITNITVSTATGGGNVTDEGMYPVTERGVCWSTNQNPMLNDPHTVDGSGLGMFVSQLTGLNPGTLYYVRAYATNQAGTAYGNQVDFYTLMTPPPPCPGVPTITYGGQVYNTALIGTQCWLRENLNIGTMINSGTSQTNNGIIEKYCYENNQANCTLYGGLYQWNEMMQYVTTPGVKGICPNGWHLPTDEELKVLEGYADSQYNYPDPVWDQTGWRGFDAGKNLKSTSGWDSNGNGADLYGFTALPGGYWGYFGVFINLGSLGTFWTSTENNSTTAWYRVIDSSADKIYRSSYNKGNGHSVRCLKD
jgi:uncharacterized protein (TIGR02145 family)